MDKNLRGYLVEMLGTFCVVFVAASAVCVNQAALITGNAHIAPGLVGIALAYGLVYAAALAAVLPHSDGYLNPAITLMQWVFKRLDNGKAIALILVQLLGAVAAGGLVRLAFTELILEKARMGTPHINFQAFGEAGPTRGVMFIGALIETVITFVVVFVLYATMVDPRFKKAPNGLGRWLTGLWAGLALIATTIAAFPYTGAAANPARWLGTVVWENSVPALEALRPFSDNGLPYWFGPIAGALLAGLVYNMLILPSEHGGSEGGGHHSHPHRQPTAATPAFSRARK